MGKLKNNKQWRLLDPLISPEDITNAIDKSGKLKKYVNAKKRTASGDEEPPMIVV